ncbi:uncharacterized protein LOC127832176 [Dreissena polymorpha]|uniref:uncharacterized protein LOC127832176 n=1 Tax=Dreissena polymorpha TaxID=45954 RepID=UPI002263BCCF|nr:uncharacterized protein LOC127832176 [Dreissena polymorpha]XP_052213437.1 uncharacterized protein LOC127832176 [Dreissena polymorpha]
MFCTNCGEKIEKHWKFCVGCGFATGTSSLPEEKLTDGPSMPCPDTDKDGSCFDNLYRALTPEARKSVNLLKMKISKKDHIEPSLSQNVMLSIQLIGMDRKLVRMLGSTPGRINMLVNRNSGPLEWANLVAEKINIKTVQPEELKFLLNKTEHEFVFSLDEVKKRATSRHRKELEVFCLLPKN